MSAGLVLLSPFFSKMSVMLPKIVSGHVIHQQNPEVIPRKFESIAEEKSIILERSRDSRIWSYPVSTHLNQADSYRHGTQRSVNFEMSFGETEDSKKTFLN